LEGLIPWDRVFVLTNEAQREAAMAELAFLPPANIIAEPAKRDTAPACALATAIARSVDPRAVCAFLPADAMIHNEGAFRDQLAQAFDLAEKHPAIVTFGIPPTMPATGFGYLHLGEADADAVFPVLRFVEKPDLPTAVHYLRSGDYAWNAGIFVWQAETFLNECERLSPPLAGFIKTFSEPDWPPRFSQLPKISVDYAILENAGMVLSVKALFDWDDVGSWSALPKHLGHDESGNTLRGPTAILGAKNNVAISNGRLIALCGVENLIVVETPDAILVCHQDDAQEIKKLHINLPSDLK
jgi:mannose-1-phosphate guanylyltransferase